MGSLGQALRQAAEAADFARTRRRTIRGDTCGPGKREKAEAVEAQRALDFPDEQPYPYA